MNKFYKELINRKKLVKFWMFLGNNLKSCFKLNYEFIAFIYKKDSLINLDLLILNIKKIVPIFNSIVNFKANFLVVTSQFMYSQSIYKENKNKAVGTLVDKKVGLLTNFSFVGFNHIDGLSFKFNPSLIFFLQLSKNDFLLLEAKKKQIPIVALVNNNINSTFIDYPIFVNSNYFYNVYFFSRFFFRYISLLA